MKGLMTIMKNINKNNFKKEEIIKNLNKIALECFPNINFENQIQNKIKNCTNFITLHAEARFLTISYNLEDNRYEIVFGKGFRFLTNPTSNSNELISNFKENVYFDGSKDNFIKLCSFISDDIINKNKIYYNKRTNYILFSKNPKEDYGMFNRNFKEISYKDLIKEE